jgi:exopolyphosphatase/guanosine-5'-triphosphate,3'-diphosphate pyrophosphatase
MAIIDLGSNSVRMNIMRINELGGYSVFDSAKEMVRLGEGVGLDNLLKPVPMERTIKALKHFKKLIEVTGVQEIFAVATAAVRMADNREVFLEKVREDVGLELRVLSGEEEAYYDYLGVVNSIGVDNCAIIDIGGGSTEIIWVKNRLLQEAVSLPFGSVILSEMFRDISHKRKRVSEALRYVELEMGKIPWIDQLQRLRVIGLGGTIRAIGKIDRGFHNYPIKNMHNYRMSDEEIERIFSLVFKTEEEELKKIEGINARRADVITMGMIPLSVLLSRTKAKGLSISGHGLRNGFFYEHYFKSIGEPLIVENVLKHSTENTMKRFDVKPVHAQQVHYLALRLFDQMVSVHTFGENERKVLEIASLLHDIGMHIEYYDHHIHGLYLLLYGKINGLTNHEHLMVAFLVGNHREENIKERMREYHSLFSKKEIKEIIKLSIFLKMAEQLDRSVNNNIEDISITFSHKYVVIELYGEEEPLLEMEAVRKFRGLFYKSFGYFFEVIYAGPIDQLR